MKLTELFNTATKGWPMDEILILENDIKTQPENRGAWIETLKVMIDFERFIAWRNSRTAKQAVDKFNEITK